MLNYANYQLAKLQKISLPLHLCLETVVSSSDLDDIALIYQIFQTI